MKFLVKVILNCAYIVVVVTLTCLQHSVEFVQDYLRDTTLYIVPV